MGWDDLPSGIDEDYSKLDQHGKPKKPPHGYKVIIYVPSWWGQLLGLMVTVYITHPTKLKKEKLVAKFMNPTSAIEYAIFLNSMDDIHHAE
jgi:hypothetical protein